VFVLYMFMAISGILMETQLARSMGISSALLNEVANLWQQKPFVDIVMVQRPEPNTSMDYKCPLDYPEPVMQRMFYGSDIACDCLGITHEYITGDNRMNVGIRCDANQTEYGCR
jgi:hypothetical protein